MKLHDNDLENCYFCPWRVVSENEGKVVIVCTFDFRILSDLKTLKLTRKNRSNTKILKRARCAKFG